MVQPKKRGRHPKEEEEDDAEEDDEDHDASAKKGRKVALCFVFVLRRQGFHAARHRARPCQRLGGGGEAGGV